ncbi:DNA damage-regulated autophagy modulator protein 1 [Echinops telfairi]|uniref:DNA damage-regulated autophagy modulator protein 1 n=1 Tax=Echinops telfairi TaxID=9371 RepID=A0ABM0III3_ECHTE|nr:DNA damage-regulated autophagy modulator protein 1 [Echinops telfairi]
MLCFLKGMAFVPFLLVTWSSAAFIISYVVAVLWRHVNPFLPYISDTGTTPPESGIFGFMINFSAFLVIVCASLISITKLEWNPEEKDYVYHLVSAICEWIVAFGFVFYFLTFIQDFQSVTLRISTEINDDI